MAPNTHSNYILEILEHVIAHTKQLTEKGYCHCFCNEHDQESGKIKQFNCLPVERLSSVMRGDQQNYAEDVNNVTPYQFIWFNNSDNNIQDDETPFC